MNHLNFFLPFNKGTDKHEDHLTRAFLVLLKHSSIVLQQFYSYTFERIDIASFCPLHKLPITNISFETQVGSLPIANTYTSVLITDDKTKVTQKIEPIERTPVYDGVINFDGDVVLFIENKLRKDKVWENQLCPAVKDIPEDAELINRVAILEWKDIINILHRINESTSTPYNDKILINDFFELINLKFDYLNPYNDFSKCHTTYLAEKRIEQLLKEIVVASEKVKYHQGWGYYVELDFPEIKKIALLTKKDTDGNWNGISVAADFGSTVSQARKFYNNISSFDSLQNIAGFDIRCNMHLSFRNSGLVGIESPKDVSEKYYSYWKKDVNKTFGGVLKENLISDYLNVYEKNGIIKYDQEKQDEIKAVILDKNYTRINICPALYFEHFISKEDAMRLDKKGELAIYINNKMKDVLGLLSHNLSDIFKP